MKKFWSMPVVAFALLSVLLTTATGFFAGSAMATQAPEALVADITNTITTSLRTEQDKIKADPKQLYMLVDKIVLPHFDFQRMSRWALGKYWRKANKNERAQFAREFRALLVRTYAKALNDNYDKTIDMLPVRMRKKGKEATVRTEVQQSAGFPIPIDYKMYIKDGAWKVYDVSVDAISLIANYRTSFAKEVRKDGLPKLIARLADRNKQAKNE